MPSTFCPSCGTRIENGGVFCPSCGKPVQATAPAQAAPPVYTAAPQPAPVYAAAPQPQPQPTYQTTYNQYSTSSGGYQAQNSPPLTVGQYIGMFIIASLGIIGFIFLLIWAFGSEPNLNKKNYAKAVLLLGLIISAVSILVFIIFGAVLAPAISDMINSY